jgi:chromosome segregation ATPase
MESEQVEKRLQWLDDERRKDKNTIAQLEERIVSLEGDLAASKHEAVEMSGEITLLKTIVSRMDHFDESLAQQRKEFVNETQNIEKQAAQRDDEIMSVLRTEIKTYDSPIYELRKDLDSVRDVKKEIQSRIMEDNRINRRIDDLGKDLEDIKRMEEEQGRLYRLIEDGRRQDSKRLTDLQGEMIALRKRSDEHRGRIDVTDTTIRRLETRLNELVISEQERSDAQAAFQEKQALIAVEREAAWKAWEERFNTIEKQSIDVENQLQSLDATYLTVKRTQEAVDDLMLRVERRINEVAEIQRLAEERFRQEWNTFRADDQKRWTNYTLSQDEQRGEFGRRFDRMSERLTIVEDSFQEIQDALQYVTELNAQSLKTLLSTIHEWASGYERSSGLPR